MKKVLRKKQYYLMFSYSLFLMFFLLISPSYAQEPVEELSGWFSIIWGDSEDGTSSILYTLADADMQDTILQLDETVIKDLGGVMKFNGRHVSVQGTLDTASDASMRSASAQVSQEVFNVISISIAPQLKTQALAIDDVPEAAVTGANPWVTIMCKFSDKADEPNDVSYFNGMYSSTNGLNDYWKELSFDIANINGSGVGGTGWYTLPYTVSHYNESGTKGGTEDLYALADDCIAAADADVDYTLYEGINMMFNFDFDYGYAWGGSIYRTLDGEFKRWSITWEPPWSYRDISVIAHEMGHGFGLPHSDAPGMGTYDNPWDVMSKDRYNCSASTDPTYGCMAQHTISYHKDMLGWIPSARKLTVSSGTETTVVLEDLASPATSNYQMVKVMIGDTSSYYSLEARKFTGYDVKVPDEGIVIHDVGTSAVLEPDGANTNLWSVGETFVDEENDITVTVNADTGTGFEVTINNDTDTDNDGIQDDNCPETWNAEQKDADNDTIGDLCDDTPGCGGCGDSACEESLTDKVEELLTHYYLNILDRSPDSGGFAYWTDVIISLVSSGGDLKEGFISFAQTFFNSQEYLDRNRTNTEYIRDLYNTFFDREFDTGGLAYWVGELGSGASRDEVLDQFVNSEEFDAFMDELFFGIS